MRKKQKRYSEREAPERFYHGFLLGLMVEQRENYIIHSNQESGFGRYDIMIIPCEGKNSKLPAVVLEFKVHNKNREKSLEDTVKVALQQITDKDYDRELIEMGFAKEQIHHYGFAFEGKKVLIV